RQAQRVADAWMISGRHSAKSMKNTERRRSDHSSENVNNSASSSRKTMRTRDSGDSASPPDFQVTGAANPDSVAGIQSSNPKPGTGLLPSVRSSAEIEPAILALTVNVASVATT